MTHITGGYDGDKDADETQPTPPDEGPWLVEIVEYVQSKEPLVRITFDGHPLGMLKLPSIAHASWLKVKVQPEHQKDDGDDIKFLLESEGFKVFDVLPAKIETDSCLDCGRYTELIEGRCIRCAAKTAPKEDPNES